MTRHRFRFFVAGTHEPGAQAALSVTDQAHVRVLRLGDGDTVEAVDASGACFDAQLTANATQLLLRARQEPAAATDTSLPPIELIAGALTGARFDELVDGAAQAGATRIVPLALRRADSERLATRRDRLQRIATAAAKQAKRSHVPDIAAPIDVAGLLAHPAGIIVDASAPMLLTEVLAQPAQLGEQTCLLIGPAEGLHPDLVQQLVERGWHAGRLGPTILRAELAAAVAVAIAALR